MKKNLKEAIGITSEQQTELLNQVIDTQVKIKQLYKYVMTNIQAPDIRQQISIVDDRIQHMVKTVERYETTMAVAEDTKNIEALPNRQSGQKEAIGESKKLNEAVLTIPHIRKTVQVAYDEFDGPIRDEVVFKLQADNDLIETTCPNIYEQWCDIIASIQASETKEEFMNYINDLYDLCDANDIILN